MLAPTKRRCKMTTYDEIREFEREVGRKLLLKTIPLEDMLYRLRLLTEALMIDEDDLREAYFKYINETKV